MENKTFIPYGRQHITPQDIDAVVQILQSEYLTQGPAIARFEQSIANDCNAKHAIAVSNATAGLHIACLAAGLGTGDWLWTSPNTFVASANCALYCGAQVDFVDIDPNTYNLSIAELERKLIAAKKENRLPKVVVPVHFAGQACEMEKIKALSNEYEFLIIEDAAHAIGGAYQNQKIGSCAYSDMTVFSFHPVKIITTGEGGMVLTNRDDLAEKLVRLRTHGITRDASQLTQESPAPWAYEQLELGLNYRMSDLQAALGESQRRQLDAFVAKRRQLAARYDALLKDLPVITPWQHPETDSAFHLYVIRLKAHDRLSVFQHLKSQGIGVNVHYIPVHTQPYYQKLGFHWGDFPEAEAYYHSVMTLPLFYDLTETDQDFIVSTLKNALR